MALLRLIHAAGLPDPAAVLTRLQGQAGSLPAPTSSARPAAETPSGRIPADFAGLVGLLEEHGKRVIAQQLHDQNAPYHEQLRGGFQAIAKTLLENPNDVAAAQALLDQQSVTEKTLKSNMLNAASKALNVLTAEQRAKVGQFIAEREARHNSKR